jgi:UDP-N-acetylglucosamine acyltransferase
MANAHSPRIHPTALISPEAELAEDVGVGPFTIVEGHVRIGSGCVLRAHVHLCGPLTLGRNNTVYSGAVLGERPQHLKYYDEPTCLDIGDENIFREHVTIHRGTTATGTTRIGSRNFFMANAHVAHDCVVGNNCILANGALVGGHCTIGDNVYLSGNSAVHQFCRVGRLALLSGCSATSKDIPPFTMQQGINILVGVNVIGMRRAGLTTEQINAVRRAYHVLYREGRALSAATVQVEQELGHIGAVAELVAFIRESVRGVSTARDPGRSAAA